MRGALKYVVAATVAVLLPSLALAQGTLTGTVRDASGAVLPGVTVEASSDALIEKVKTATSDNSGQWRIVDLRPGIYRLSFTLTGFSTVIREEVEMTGSATLSIPVDMRVGNLAEQIVVTAETPVVDVQSVKREVVLQSEFIASLPATRNYSAILQMIPALDVGIGISAETTPTMNLFTARGGNPNEGRITIDGMTVAAPFNGGGVSSVVYNTADVTEIQVQISGGLGENETGGPRLNIIPRSGGNSFSGRAFFSTAGEWSRSENIDEELRSFGITRGPTIKQQIDTDGSFGGPIKRDRLWFYANVRTFSSARIEETSIGGNLNALNRNNSDPNSWLFRLDPAVEEVRNVQSRDIYAGRLTGQVGKNRLTFSREHQYRCDGSTLMPDADGGCRQRGANWTAIGSANTSPEAAAEYFPQPYYTTQATWTIPMTSRLLLEAGFSRLSYEPVFGRPAPDTVFDIIPVTEQSSSTAGTTDLAFAPRNNVGYRALGNYLYANARNNNIRASGTYVTGAHSMKVGYQGAIQLSDETTRTNPNLTTYRFQRGVPNQFTVRLPNWSEAGRTVQHSMYAQDQWTLKRLTLQGAVRYDHAYSWSPTEGNGTTTTSPFNAQPITFDRTVSVRGYDDITVRTGVAYDLFGTGKTALKMNLGKYVDAATNDSNYTVNNPANRILTTMSRNWTDNDGDKVIDCSIMNFAAQGPTATGANQTVDTCAAVTGNALRFANFQTGLTQINPAILGGRGVRPYDWQFGVGVQQEVLPRVSVDVAYNRRWWGNFFVTDNQALGPNDFESWTATAPLDPRLPGGGGYTFLEFELAPGASGRTPQNYTTFETDFGPARINYWHGVEVTVNGRMRNGLIFQGGTSTGREVEDRCETLPNFSRAAGQSFTRSTRACHDVDPFRTNFRGSASYTVPKADVLVSAIVRLSPAPALSAGSYLIPNQVVQDQLGHLPAGALITGTQSVTLTDAEHRLYAERSHKQVDMRFAKVLRMGRARADLGIDLYNVFNVNTPTAYEGDYDSESTGGQWMTPTGIVQPRFARFNITLNF
jgi:hypothetical protein